VSALPEDRPATPTIRSITLSGRDLRGPGSGGPAARSLEFGGAR